MRIAWASDVHFDFVEPEDVEAWCGRIRAAGVEGLLLGGDIATAGSVLFWVERCAELLERPLYFVLGNHDYYRGSVAEVRAGAARLPAPVHWLSRSSSRPGWRWSATAAGATRASATGRARPWSSTTTS